MRKLYILQNVLRLASLLFAWLCVMTILCFISLMSWQYIFVLLIAIGNLILYSIQPKVFCNNSIIFRLILIFYLSIIAGFIFTSCFAISQLGSGPVLLHGTQEFGSSRNWGIGIAIFMTLCAICGPINLLLTKKYGLMTL
jgi:hypothetical protein